MKRTYCKLDDKCIMSFELAELHGKTFMTIVDRKCTHNQTAYKEFANINSYVDKYRLLKLADYIYEYCNDSTK